MQALFVNQLTTLDFSYLCPKRGLVGETWLVDVTLWGELNSEGMVFDFGHVKKQIKAELDRLADHRLLVPAREARITTNDSGYVDVRFAAQSGTISCQAPQQAILAVDATAITPEGVTPFLERAVMQILPDNVAKIDIHLHTEEIDGAYYHYSHGLKKHAGDCQRIAHGHRSRIHIFVDEQRDEALEAEWAIKWQDIYLATREDLQEAFTQDGVEYYRFGYTAGQGSFAITLPGRDCYLIDSDTTVELLACHLVHCVAQSRPGKNIKVIAYEGLDKGSMVCQ